MFLSTRVLLLTIICTVIATICVALPTPAHIMLQDGHEITISGAECKELFYGMFNIGHTNLDDTSDEIQPGDAVRPDIDPYNVYIYKPIENLHWWNFTDTSIDALEVDECTVSRDIHGYAIVAKGIDVTISGAFAYAFEEKMPVLEDSGNYQMQIHNATLLARLNHYGKPTLRSNFDSIDDFINEYDEENTVADDEDDSGIWVADVATLIPEKLIGSTFNTDYAAFYNNIIEEHNLELRTVLSVLSNMQIKAALENYCNVEHDCSDQSHVWAQLLNESVNNSRLSTDFRDHDLLRPTNVIPN